MSDRDTKPLIGVLGAVTAMAIWAGWLLVTRVSVVDRVDPLMLALCRNIVPAVLLFPIIWRRGIIPRGASLPAVAMMALGWGVLFAMFCGFGLRTVPASLFAPLAPGLAPILVAIIAAFFFGVHLRRHVVAGLILVGLSLLLVLGNWVLDADHAALQGAGWLMAASLGFAIYTVNFRRSGLSPIEATAYVGFWSLPLVLPFWWLQPDAFRAFTLQEWALHLTVQGLLAGIAAGVAYALAIRHLGTVRGAMVNALMPVISGLAGFWVLDESLGASGWTAIILASLGVAAANGVFRRRQPVQEG